ncbi:MAG: 2-oxo acid dehydrogenase subunit E2 [Bauldia sp.]|nr:2-oxo acid dehydrogenase subunit E2 [Bauldia sp.]
MNVLMPQLGETVSEGKVIKWFKSVGDAVAAGENLCEIETDKVTVEVPAISPGVLQAINVEVGTVAPVGAIIAVVGDGRAQAGTGIRPPAAPPVTAPPQVRAPAASPVSTVFNHPSAEPRRTELDPFNEVRTPRQNFGPARLASGVVVTPLARRLAANGAIDLSRVAGSGASGRITGKDVEKAIASRPALAPSLARAEMFEELIGEAHLSRPHKVVPVDGMRHIIARRLVAAKATIPHFYLSADVMLDRLSRVREEINAGAPKDAEGAPTYKLSINDFLIKALALALQEVPRANAIWSGDEILAFQHSDVGVAVAVPDGLLTPVVAAAELKTLSTISNEMKALAARARDRALQPHEYQGGATTISNLGMYGVREFTAIINPPQSTILAVGAARRDAIEAEDGGVRFVSRISVTLSCDHRVIDGVDGAELLASFRELVENPLRMVV